MQRFVYLLGAFWVREGLRAVFLISLARQSTTTYGEFMLAMSIGQILLYVAEFGLNQHLVSLLTKEGEEQTDILLQASVLKGMLLLCGSVGTIFFMQWQGYAPGLQAVVLILSFSIGLEAIASSFFVACQVQGRQDAEGKIKSLAASFGFGYGLLALFSGAGPIPTAFFKTIETMANLTGAALVSRKWKTMKIQWPRFWNLWTTARGSVVFTLMAIATSLYNYANIFFLQKAAGSDGVAHYSVTWEMVEGVASLTTSLLLRNVLFPLFVNLWGNDRTELKRLVQESSRWLMAVSIPIMFVLAVESDRLITLLYGNQYGDAIWMQRYLVVTILIAFLHNLAAYLMISMRKQNLLLIIYTGGLLFNLVICSLAIPAYPLMGTVLSIISTKAVVGMATVTYCQVQFGLFARGPLLHLGGAMAAGGLLYLLGGAFLFREAAEFMALIPISALAFSWRRQLSHAMGGLTP